MTYSQSYPESELAILTLAEEIEESEGIALMLPAGAIQIGIKNSAIVIAALRHLAGATNAESSDGGVETADTQGPSSPDGDNRPNGGLAGVATSPSEAVQMRQGGPSSTLEGTEAGSVTAALHANSEPVAWRITDGEGDYTYSSDEPRLANVEWARRYSRKHEPLFLGVAQAPGKLPDPCFIQTASGPMRYGKDGWEDATRLAQARDLISGFMLPERITDPTLADDLAIAIAALLERSPSVAQGAVNAHDEATLFVLVERAMDEWENDREPSDTISCAQHIARKIAAAQRVPPVDRYEEAMAAINACIGVSAWRLIKTAPKDGTEILVTREGEGFLTRIVSWSPAPQTDHWAEPQDSTWRVAHNPSACMRNSTHWMPLPFGPSLPSTGRSSQIDHSGDECPNFPGCHCVDQCCDGWKHPSPEHSSTDVGGGDGK